MALVRVVRALRAAHLVGVDKALGTCRGLPLSPHRVNSYCKDVLIDVDLYSPPENLFILSLSLPLLLLLSLSFSFSLTHIHLLHQLKLKPKP